MEEKKITLSVALAVRNEEGNLSSCLSAVEDIADEIVVVDGESTDQTVSIARKYANKVIGARNEQMFHINKQIALDACTSTWILQLDADEIVTKELKEEIIRTIHNEYETRDNEHETESIRQKPMSMIPKVVSNIHKNQEPRTKNHEQINGFAVPRRNYFWGHFMKKGGQYPDYVIRLIRNGKARFPCTSVHEQIHVTGEVGYLKNPLLHYSYRTKEEYWKKADAYISLTALELKKNGLPKTFSSWFDYTVRKPVFTFFNLFLRHKGFMDGIYGLVFAYWSALHFPIAYRKFLKE